MTNDYLTRTQSFNIIKDLLGIPKKSTVRKYLFVLLFTQIDDVNFLIKGGYESLKNYFTKEQIPDLNKRYYTLKQDGKTDQAKVIADEVHKKISEFSNLYN